MVLLVATLGKSGIAERSTKSEGLPKNISIEEFLDEPSGKPITAQSMEFLDEASEQSSSGLSYFRQVVQEDA